MSARMVISYVAVNLQNGILGPILKTLNAILGSLASVFEFAEV
jgi:hypothetical protein